MHLTHANGNSTTEGPGDAQHVFSGFDAVLLAMPAEPARDLLQASRQAKALAQRIGKVQVAPCWTLMLAFPQATQPGLSTLGPQWNAARSTHHRIAWLARESSKPGRNHVERWTVQASAAWSQRALGRRRPAGAGQAAQGLLRSHRHPRRTQPRGQPALALRPDPAAPGSIPFVGRQDRHRRLRRLVPGPPGRRRLPLGSGTGTGSRLTPALRRFAGRRSPAGALAPWGDPAALTP